MKFEDKLFGKKIKTKDDKLASSFLNQAFEEVFAVPMRKKGASDAEIQNLFMLLEKTIFNPTPEMEKLGKDLAEKGVATVSPELLSQINQFKSNGGKSE